MKTLKKITLILALTMFFQNSFAQMGSLDLSFNASGKVITAVSNDAYSGCGLAIQGDSKIIMAGTNHNLSDDFMLIRYNIDGSLDNTFDADGKLTTDFGSEDRGKAVAIQNDGKIVVAGNSLNGGNNNFALARYNTDGSLDNTFDTDGKVSTVFGTVSDSVCSMAIQADGKIVVVGTSWVGSSYYFAVARYNTNGSLDNTFDTDGKLTTLISGTYNEAYDVSIQNDGKIVVVGISAGTFLNFTIVRYNTNGSLDNTFDTDGKVITPMGSNNSWCKSVAIQGDGKIVASGYAYNGANFDFSVVRYNTDGSLDATFDNDGKVNSAIGNSDDEAYAVTLQLDGKIVVSGASKNASNYDFSLIRYNTNGSLDSTFDNDGKLTTVMGAMDDYGYSVAMQGDKIVIGGVTYTASSCNFALSRYISCQGAGGIINPSSSDPVIINGQTYSISGTYLQHLVNVQGCDSLLTINLTIAIPQSQKPLGIKNETTAAYIIDIYPNPTQGKFSVSNVNNVRVINSLGAIIYNSSNDEFYGSIEIDITGNGPGIYFIQAHTANGLISKKLILTQ